MLVSVSTFTLTMKFLVTVISVVCVVSAVLCISTPRERFTVTLMLTVLVTLITADLVTVPTALISVTLANVAV